MRIKPEGALVKKIVFWYDQNTLYAIQLFDKDGVKLLETGYKDAYSKNSKEVILEDDERIVGFKSRLRTNGFADHNDFQFIIGRME